MTARKRSIPRKLGECGNCGLQLAKREFLWSGAVPDSLLDEDGQRQNWCSAECMLAFGVNALEPEEYREFVDYVSDELQRPVSAFPSRFLLEEFSGPLPLERYHRLPDGAPAPQIAGEFNEIIRPKTSVAKRQHYASEQSSGI